MKNIIAFENLQVSGVDWLDKALTAGQTYYSDKISSKGMSGYAALLLKTDASITVSFQVSLDGVSWHDPQDGNGTSLATIATALAADSWRRFSPQLCVYFRIKVVCNSNATTSIILIREKENV